ncbi:MAG: hypothetical protein ACRCXT_08905 [Paraclostridium sp.]
MAAITSVLNLIEITFRKKINPKGFISIGYYETIYFLRGKLTNLEFVFDNNKLESDYEFYFIEPTKANFKLEESPIDELLKFIAERNNKIKYLIIDSSMQGNTFSINKFLKSIEYLKNIVIINIRSGLKLDQEGMEVCSAGLVTCYFSKNLEFLIESTKKFLEQNRDIYGNGLTYNNICLLDNEIFFKNNDYSKIILDNSKEFSKKINYPENKLFNHIIYPHSEDNNFLTPYLFLKFEKEIDGNLDDYELLLDIIYEETVSLGMNYHIRNSFGFRNISCEFYKKVNVDEFVFKIAPGKLAGVRYFHFLHIINQLLKLDISEYRKLRKFYKINNWSI